MGAASWAASSHMLAKLARHIAKFTTLSHCLRTMDNIDGEARTLIRSELSRVQEFASLARNAGRDDGPLNVIDNLVKALYL